MTSNVIHEPVLLQEVINGLHIHEGGKYIDATLGAGGHTEAIIKHGGNVLGIEADAGMLKLSEERLSKNCPTLVRGNFENIEQIAHTHNFAPVDGVLMDLGISNFHYETLGRGFSFKKEDEPLDLRLSTTDTDITAATLLNVLSEKQLIQLFSEVIGVHKAKGITKKILRARTEKPFVKVFDLSRLSHAESPEVFLALRVAVNSEFEVLEKGVKGAFSVLKSGGRLAIISFHSLEDKIVMKLFRQFEEIDHAIVETVSPIIPSEEEISRNPKSRSALLRIINKI